MKFRGRTFLERALAAAAPWPAAVVLAPDAPPRLHVLARGALVVENDAPELGMSRSLALASAALGAADRALAVLLVDTPLVDAGVVARVSDAFAAASADVAYPVRDGVPGHPVVFGPRARAALAGLPPGDTVRALRDAPEFARVAVPFDGDAPFVDVDTEAAYARLLARAGARPRA